MCSCARTVHVALARGKWHDYVCLQTSLCSGWVCQEASWLHPRVQHALGMPHEQQHSCNTQHSQATNRDPTLVSP